jgi:hypothetical protein
MTQRPESGPMRFGEDWTGVFLRGDHAGPMAMILSKILDVIERGENPQMHDILFLKQLVRELADSDERGSLEGLQLLRPFEECLLPRQTVFPVPKV